MTIFNSTPHSVAFYTTAQTVFDKDTRKYHLIEGEQPYLVVQPSGKMLNVKFESQKVENVTAEMPLYKKAAISIDTLPEGYDIYIVSALYASSVKNDKVYTISDPVYSDGRVVGCLALCQI